MQQVPAIDVTDLAAELAQGAPLVDVRQPDEFEQAHIAGARLIPLGEVPDRTAELPTDETVYVVCRSGNRSGRAVEFLRHQGIDAVNVTGGMIAWADAGNAVETGG
ncbi:MAG TPA: rhodanese-like domain-containing protein [Acidimicrobiales bacterium]|nr:rhodanese-like domain-containing protein [Acidimicrobiales bacterium]